jgi:hypothetical protein
VEIEDELLGRFSDMVGSSARLSHPPVGASRSLGRVCARFHMETRTAVEAGDEARASIYHLRFRGAILSTAPPARCLKSARNDRFRVSLAADRMTDPGAELSSSLQPRSAQGHSRRSKQPACRSASTKQADPSCADALFSDVPAADVTISSQRHFSNRLLRFRTARNLVRFSL